MLDFTQALSQLTHDLLGLLASLVKAALQIGHLKVTILAKLHLCGRLTRQG